MTDAPAQADTAGAIQRALFTLLTAVPGLAPVVTETPTTMSGDQEVVLFPFVLLGDDEVTDEGSKTRRFERHEVTIHVVMQSTTKLAVRAMQNLVHAALDRQVIEPDGLAPTRVRALNLNTPLLEDGATYAGTQRFRIFAQDG